MLRARVAAGKSKLECVHLNELEEFNDVGKNKKKK